MEVGNPPQCAAGFYHELFGQQLRISSTQAERRTLLPGHRRWGMYLLLSAAAFLVPKIRLVASGSQIREAALSSTDVWGFRVALRQLLTVDIN